MRRLVLVLLAAGVLGTVLWLALTGDPRGGSGPSDRPGAARSPENPAPEVAPSVETPSPVLAKLEATLGEQRSAVLEGRVVDGRGRPVAGATVEYDPHESLSHLLPNSERPPTVRRSVTTDAEGHFRIDGLVPGPHRLDLAADGFLPRTLHTVPAPLRDLEIGLVPGYSVEGVVVVAGATPRPAFGVTIAPGDAENEPDAERVIEEDALRWHFEFSGRESPFRTGPIPAGAWIIGVRTLGYASVWKPVFLGPGEPTPSLRFELTERIPLYPVAGRIVDGETGRGVPGAEVRLHSPDGVLFRAGLRADTDGRWSAELAAGDVEVRVRAVGYADPEPTTFSVADATGELRTPLSPATAVISGRVTDPEGRPVGGAAVRVTKAEVNPDVRADGHVSWSIEQRDVTGADGRFVIDRHLHSYGRYTLVAEAGDGSARALAEDVVFAGGASRTEVDLVLEPVPSPAGSVAGRVVTRGGDPVERAVVTLAERWTVTGPDGRFRFEGVPDGEHRLEARAVEIRSAPWETVTVTGGQAVEAPDLVLDRKGISVTGTVRDSGGAPVAGAIVYVGTVEGTAKTVTLADGTFRADRLPAGDGRAQAWCPGYAGAAVREFTIEEGATVDLVLQRAGSVRGTLRFDGDTPERVALLRFRESGNWRKWSISRDRATGAWRSSHLRPGRHRLVLRAKGYAPTAPIEVEMPAGGEVNLAPVTLSPGGAISGRVLDADGKPVPWCRLSWESGLLQADVDNEGRFRIGLLPPGSREIVVYDPEIGPFEPLAKARAVVREAGVTELVIRLP